MARSTNQKLKIHMIAHLSILKLDCLLSDIIHRKT